MDWKLSDGNWWTKSKLFLMNRFVGCENESDQSYWQDDDLLTPICHERHNWMLPNPKPSRERLIELRGGWVWVQCVILIKEKQKSSSFSLSPTTSSLSPNVIVRNFHFSLPILRWIKLSFFLCISFVSASHHIVVVVIVLLFFFGCVMSFTMHTRKMEREENHLFKRDFNKNHHSERRKEKIQK